MYIKSFSYELHRNRPLVDLDIHERMILNGSVRNNL
jgi:hypothetical protein